MSRKAPFFMHHSLHKLCGLICVQDQQFQKYIYQPSGVNSHATVNVTEITFLVFDVNTNLLLTWICMILYIALLPYDWLTDNCMNVNVYLIKWTVSVYCRICVLRLWEIGLVLREKIFNIDKNVALPLSFEISVIIELCLTWNNHKYVQNLLLTSKKKKTPINRCFLIIMIWFSGKSMFSNNEIHTWKQCTLVQSCHPVPSPSLPPIHSHKPLL